MHFITDPYLPNGQVKMIIAGDGLREYEKAMQSLGISVLYTKKADCISGALATHADLVVFSLRQRQIFIGPRARTACHYASRKRRGMYIRKRAEGRIILWTCLITLSKSEKR